MDNYGEISDIELKKEGRNIEVCDANKEEFVGPMLNWVFKDSIQKQMDAINTGIGEIIPIE